MTGRGRAQAGTAAFYAAMFGAFGAHLPFWPVWLQDWGLSAGEVGAYLSFFVLVRVVAGFALPVLADRLDSRRLFVSGLGIAGAVLFIGHLWIEDRTLLMLGTIATGAVIAGMMPLGEALGNAAATRYGFAYAPARAVGSVAFLVASLAVGIGIARFGADVALWWIVVFMLAVAWLGLRHPGGGHVATAPPGFGDIARLMTAPVFLIFVLATGLGNSSHAVYYAYGSVHWRALGIGEDMIGALWAFSIAVEVAFMVFAGQWLIRRTGPVGAMAVAGAGGVVRWVWMMFDPGLAALWVLQAMHTLSFVCGHLGAMAFIAQAVPERYGGSAQGAYMGFAGGLLTAAAMGLAALVYPVHGGATYGIAAAMSALALASAIWLARAWKGGEIALRTGGR